jgi:hypothetical protein
MYYKILTATIKLECSRCGKTFTNVAQQMQGHQSCDCDYPCSCDNGFYEYLSCECTHCGMDNKIKLKN